MRLFFEIVVSFLSVLVGVVFFFGVMILIANLWDFFNWPNIMPGVCLFLLVTIATLRMWTLLFRGKFLE